jgi:hypothetical protein
MTSGCEIEKTEYDRYMHGENVGFTNGIFIMHKQSFSYYSPNQNKVYNDLYFHQNGDSIRNGVNSFLSGGIISYEKDNLIEFLDMRNFKSEGYLDIDHPRDLTNLNGTPLISYGKAKNGAIAYINSESRELVNTIPLTTEPGKVFIDDDYYNTYLYVLSSGNSINDSIIYRLYQSDSNPLTLHKLDSIHVGIRPVDCVPYIAEYQNYYHDALAILCLGSERVPPCVKILDLITFKVVASYEFESTYKPQNLFWFARYNAQEPLLSITNNKLLSNVNNKLYKITLANPIQLTVLIDKNINELKSIDMDYFIAVSRDTLKPKSSLYRFDKRTLELRDSLVIEGKAIKIVNSYY